jgi:uncharacterized protein
MNDLFEKAAQFLQEKLNGSASIDDIEKRYRFEHSLRVATIARTIAEKEGQDVFTATMAAILHDAGKFDTDVNEDHGRVSAHTTRPFLQTLNLSEKQVNDILYCIAVHVDGNAGYNYPHIDEAETVSDSDNIDRFGVYRIYQSMCWDKAELIDADELAEKYKDRIDRLKSLPDRYNPYTATAREMFAQNLNIQIGFYKNLVKELELTALSAWLNGYRNG